MGVTLFVTAFLALPVQVIGIALALHAALYRITSLPEAALIIVLATLALQLAYGHLVFIALLYRRLQRQGSNLRIPNAVGRVLGRLMDGIQI